MRVALVVLVTWLLPALAAAQASAERPAPDSAQAPDSAPDSVSVSAPDSVSDSVSDSVPEPAPAPDPDPVPAPKVAVIVVGDADPVLVASAVEIEAHLAVSGEVRLPADTALRAALRGDTGAPDDGLVEVRRERRRLGLGEASDAPVLARLGRRAGAVLAIAVREGERGPEAVALDVRSAQFFDGALPLTEPDPERIQRFVARRAGAAARGAAAPIAGAAAVEPEQAGPAPPSVPVEATQADEPGDEPDWFEQNWPYFAAGGLLAAAIAFVAVTASDGGEAPPMLRFQPPGEP